MTTKRRKTETITPTDMSEPPAEYTLKTQVLDDNLEVDDPEAFNAALREKVAEGLKSRRIRTKTVNGKAALFDLKTHTNVDYTAGGLFHPRLVLNNEDKIRSHRQLNGYKFPEEYGVGLKNIQIASHVLMLCPTETYLARKAQQQGEAAALTRDRQAQHVAQAGEGFGEYDVKPVSQR